MVSCDNDRCFRLFADFCCPNCAASVFQKPIFDREINVKSRNLVKIDKECPGVTVKRLSFALVLESSGGVVYRCYMHSTPKGSSLGGGAIGMPCMPSQAARRLFVILAPFLQLIVEQQRK